MDGRTVAGSVRQRRRGAFGLVLLAAVAAPVAAAAEWRTLQHTALCRTHAEFTDALVRVHGETRAWWGLSGQGTAVLELHISRETGSWTLLRVEPDGTACSLGGGETSRIEPGNGDRPS